MASDPLPDVLTAEEMRRVVEMLQAWKEEVEQARAIMRAVRKALGVPVGDGISLIEHAERLATELRERWRDGKVMRQLLRDVYPTVRNAADDPNASPWQREIRSKFADRIDAAMKEHADG